MKPLVTLIAIMGENRVIGNKGKIPWRIREDLRHFRDKTLGHVCIVGRKTFTSLEGYYQRSSRPWPKRTHIIITRDTDFHTDKPDCLITHSFTEALNLAKKIEKEEIFVIGGGQIYEAAMPVADKLYLTVVKGSFEGDAYFPVYSRFKTVISKIESQNEKYTYTFLELIP